MGAKRIHQQQPSRQTDRSQSQSKKNNSDRATFQPNKDQPNKDKPLEVAAEAAPNAMWDNVMRSNAAADIPAEPPREFLQPKLSIGAPRDKYEQEADHTAKQVVQRIRAPIDSFPNSNPLQLQRQIPFDSSRDFLAPTEIDAVTLQTKTEAYRQIWGDVLQANERELAGGMINNDFEGELNRARSGGQPLDPQLQNQMGEAFGADFSGVKVHTDSQSHQLNQSIQAKAFTTGKDVFFKQGEYQPGSQSGQELIAHELTHIVQQNGNAIQKKETQETETNKSLANSIQRQSETIIQRFWDEAKCVKLPRQGKILKGGTLIDWSATSECEVWKNEDINITFADYQTFDGHQFFVFKDTQDLFPHKKDQWWGVYEDVVTFNGLTVYNIFESKREWEVLQLPTEADTILSNTQLEQLKEKFLMLGSEKTNFIDNVIDSKTGDELKYRLKGCIERDSLEKNVIDEYAAQKIQEAKIVEKGLEWTALDITDPGSAKENYLTLSDDHSERFRNAIAKAKKGTPEQVLVTVTALHSGSSIGDIEKALTQQKRKEEWPILELDSIDPGSTKTNYLELSDEDAKTFRIAIYDARIESGEQVTAAVTALHNGNSIGDIKGAIADKAREEEWPLLGVATLFDSDTIPNRAQAKYLVLDDANAKKFSVMLSAWGTDIDKKKESVTAFADETATLDTLLGEARQAAEGSRRGQKWESFNFEVGGDIRNETILGVAKDKYLNLTEKEAHQLEVILKETERKDSVVWQLTGASDSGKFKTKILDRFQNDAANKIKERINATYKVEMKKNWTVAELEDIEAALKRFQYLLGDLRKVGIGEQELKEVIRSRRNREDEETAGMTHGDKIYMYDKSQTVDDFVKVTSSPTLEERRQGFRGTMTHELTHALIADAKIREDVKYHRDYANSLDFWQTKMNTKFGGDNWKERIKNGKAGGVEVPITDYGAKNAEEDLCEAVMFYFEDQATLQRKCPLRFNFIRDNIQPLLDAPVSV